MKRFVTFEVHGMTPVPWSVPDVGNATTKYGKRVRFAKKNKPLEAWQQYVKLFAADAMVGKAVTLAPLFVKLQFSRLVADPDLWGEVWVQEVAWNEEAGEYTKKGQAIPDVDNLSKGTVDALQGAVFGNDVQVCKKVESRLYGPYDGVRVDVWEITEDDRWPDDGQ